MTDTAPQTATATATTATTAKHSPQNNSSILSGTQFYAIRACPSLKSSAIFCCWDDCCTYIESSNQQQSKENETKNDDDKSSCDVDGAEYETFDTLSEAVEYIESYFTRSAEQVSLGLPVTTFPSTTTEMTVVPNNTTNSTATATMTDTTATTTTPPMSGRKRPASWLNFPAAAVAAAAASGTDPSSDDIVFPTYPELKNPPTKEVDEEQAERDFEYMFKMYQETVAAQKPISSVKKLGTWINRQRRPGTKLTVERFLRLTKAGFSFQKPSKKRYMTWHDRAVQWKEYHAKHGDKEPSDYHLRAWVASQRSKYHKYKTGEKSNLSLEQMRKLTGWGFDWRYEGSPQPTFEKISSRASWEERVKEVEAFKKAHGHTRVPRVVPGLGSWVYKQREEYRKYMSKGGPRTTLTKERLDKLNEIGFEFDEVQNNENYTRRSRGRPKKNQEQKSQQIQQQQQGREMIQVAEKEEGTTMTTAQQQHQSQQNNDAFNSSHGKDTTTSQTAAAPTATTTTTATTQDILTLDVPATSSPPATETTTSPPNSSVL